jgi:hypothetical protein
MVSPCEQGVISEEGIGIRLGKHYFNTKEGNIDLMAGAYNSYLKPTKLEELMNQQMKPRLKC